jgi:hypothetical protein
MTEADSIPDSTSDGGGVVPLHEDGAREDPDTIMLSVSDVIKPEVLD